MTLPLSGQLSLDDIADEFNDLESHKLSEFYGAYSNVPTSGQISISDLYGSSFIPPYTNTMYELTRNDGTSIGLGSSVSYSLRISDNGTLVVLTEFIFNQNAVLGHYSVHIWKRPVGPYGWELINAYNVTEGNNNFLYRNGGFLMGMKPDGSAFTGNARSQQSNYNAGPSHTFTLDSQNQWTYTQSDAAYDFVSRHHTWAYQGSTIHYFDGTKFSNQISAVFTNPNPENTQFYSMGSGYYYSGLQSTSTLNDTRVYAPSNDSQWSVHDQQSPNGDFAFQYKLLDHSYDSEFHWFPRTVEYGYAAGGPTTYTRSDTDPFPFGSVLHLSVTSNDQYILLYHYYGYLNASGTPYRDHYVSIFQKGGIYGISWPQGHRTKPLITRTRQIYIGTTGTSGGFYISKLGDDLSFRVSNGNSVGAWTRWYDGNTGSYTDVDSTGTSYGIAHQWNFFDHASIPSGNHKTGISGGYPVYNPSGYYQYTGFKPLLFI